MFIDEIFDAFVPSVMNSPAWQAELLAAQQHVLESAGSQGGGLRKILRHLSYAKQRPG